LGLGHLGEQIFWYAWIPRPPLYPTLFRKHTMNPTLVLPLGRALMALAFIGPGASHFLDSAKQRNYTAAAVGAIEVAAGLALAFGWQVRWLALAAAAFLLADAVLAHNFWAATPQELRNHVLHFFKNLALAGGFVLLATSAAAR
jgi:putative oxidoreductase